MRTPAGFPGNAAVAAPKVSVLMVAYNHEPFIAQAVESVLRQQTEFEYEIVIADDCSADGTRHVLVAYQRRWPGTIRLVLQERNLGALGKHNFVAAFQRCTGQYVALLEGDDFWNDPRKLQKQVDFLDRNPGFSGCFHDAWFLHQCSEEVTRHGPARPKAAYTFDDLLDTNVVITPTVVFRRGLFDTFPAWFYQAPVSDWPLHLLNTQSRPYGYLPEAMSVYRVHSGGVSSGLRHSQRLLMEVGFYEALQGCFHPRHERMIRDARLRAVFWAASFSEREGDRRQARTLYGEYLRHWSARRTVRRLEVAKLGMRIFTPRVYRFLKRSVRRISS